MATPRVGVAAPSAGVGVPAGAPALAAPALPINQPTPAGAVIGPITLQSVIPWVNGVVAPAASLTAPPVGNANGFTNGELPNGASTKQFTIPANPAVAASVPANGQLPTTGSACKPWQPPAANVGANVWVLGCIGVPGGWACSDTQLASPAATPSCFGMLSSFSLSMLYHQSHQCRKKKKSKILTQSACNPPTWYRHQRPDLLRLRSLDVRARGHPVRP
ncbi:hypothetical protein BC828DRAFT_142133 [Blastocladiella britannica]|nr:hypothetical protein BC828DRAFT_142133 [Blastocladiella britannica]